MCLGGQLRSLSPASLYWLWSLWDPGERLNGASPIGSWYDPNTVSREITSFLCSTCSFRALTEMIGYLRLVWSSYYLLCRGLDAGCLTASVLLPHPRVILFTSIVTLRAISVVRLTAIPSKMQNSIILPTRLLSHSGSPAKFWRFKSCNVFLTSHMVTSSSPCSQVR